MAHIHKKIKKGRAYYYIRENARINGQSKVVRQIYLGTAEKIMAMAKGQESTEINRLQVQEFGSLWIANQIEAMQAFMLGKQPNVHWIQTLVRSTP